jgi:hypothetical protein
VLTHVLRHAVLTDMLCHAVSCRCRVPGSTLPVCLVWCPASWDPLATSLRCCLRCWQVRAGGGAGAYGWLLAGTDRTSRVGSAC